MQGLVQDGEEAPRASSPPAAAAGESIATQREAVCTHHITDGGDVSDSHLVHSVPLAVIFIK